MTFSFLPAALWMSGADSVRVLLLGFWSQHESMLTHFMVALHRPRIWRGPETNKQAIKQNKTTKQDIGITVPQQTQCFVWTQGQRQLYKKSLPVYFYRVSLSWQKIQWKVSLIPPLTRGLGKAQRSLGKRKKKKVGFCKCAVSTGIHEQLYLLGTEVVAEFSRAQ